MARRSNPRAAPLADVNVHERLRQAEETLRAIQAGEVDAFVTANGRSLQIALLDGAEHPYVTLIERINEGAVTLSGDGVILYCNGFLAEFLRLPREAIIGSALRDFVAPEDRSTFDALLVRGRAGGSHGDITLRMADGIGREVLLSLSPLAPLPMQPELPAADGPLGVIGIVTDLTLLKTTEQRLATRMRQQAAIAELGRRALVGGTLDAVLADATQLVVDTLGAAQAGIAELPPEGGRLRVRAATGVRRPVGVMADGEDALARLVLDSGDPVVVDDVAADLRFSVRSLPGGHGMVSAIAVLVMDDGAPFGVLQVSSPIAERFSVGDTDFLRAVSNVLTATIARKRSEDLRRWLLEEATTSRDVERRRLSRELHDEARQSLWALVVGLHSLATVVEVDHARTTAQRLHLIASRTLDDIGRLARGIHPGALDDHGLEAAATQYVSDFSESHGIPVEHVVEPLDKVRLPPDVELTLYRILQEALTNVARHASARSVRVTLRRAATAVELTVADDGVGFRPKALRGSRPTGLGLHGMRERASMLGGEVIVASEPGQSTTVTARIPLRMAAQ